MQFFENNIANAALAEKNPARIPKGRHWQSGIGLEGLREFYEHTGDARALEALKVLTADCFQKKDWAESTLHAFAFLGAQLDNAEYTARAKKQIQTAAKGIVDRPWGYGQSFGNELRNAPYVLWYLTKDLPKKCEPKKMEF
jgi:rhamnogalacturonyl hydrolase YesR